jgi:Calx-beta domain
VNLSSEYDADIKVDYTSADLADYEEYWYGPSATAGVDYQATSGTLTIPAHTTSATIPVSVIGDRVGEPDENFWMKISNPNYAHLGYPTQSLATIVNDEPYVSISNAPSVTEGNTGTTTTMNFTVSLSAPATAPITVTFATADGSALSGSDYVANSNSVTFNVGDQTKTIPVTVKGDRIGEGDEYLYVNLTGADGAVISSSYAYGYILDDEPKISINSPASITEGDKGTKPLTFTVTLSAPYDQTVTVFYTTVNYSAAAGSDYVATSGTLTFTAGQTSKPITVQIKGDRKKESTEYFYVQLSSPSTNASISNSSGWATILDDDGPHGRP